MNVALVSLYTPDYELGRHMEANVRRYAKKWKHDFVCFHNTLDAERHTTWSKLQALYQVIETGKYDWVMWIDADAFIANHNIDLRKRLAEILQPHREPEPDMILSKDYFTGMNNGIFLLRANQRGLDFLTETYSHVECAGQNREEQDGMNAVLSKYRVIWVPKRMFNSYLHPFCGGRYRRGDFIVHLAGLHKLRKTRQRFMESFSQEGGEERLGKQCERLVLFQIIVMVLFSVVSVLAWKNKNKVCAVSLTTAAICFASVIYFVPLTDF